jgi:high-affinity nickel-transport protein
LISSLARSFGDPHVRHRVIAIYAFLFLFNAVVWAVTLLVAVQYPIILSGAVPAYLFGLRHAVDPDHIAAIDNTTRKLMQDKQRPVGVGFFFSWGHSTVVIVLSALLALSSAYVRDHLPQFRATGSIIGTSVSAAFLIVIGVINLIVLIDIYRQFRQVRKGGEYQEQTLDDYLANRGLLARIFRPALRLVDRSWKMYPVGFLFGLGFDTASEVGLLGIAAAFGARGSLPIVFILLLPLLFTAGMSLIDTTDGVLMLGAYGWAFVKPIRKLYYNLNITLISVLVALVIGGIEALQVIGQQTGGIASVNGGTVGNGWFWGFVNSLDLQNLGFLIIAVFAVSWLVSTLVYRIRGYDRLGGETKAA